MNRRHESVYSKYIFFLLLTTLPLYPLLSLGLGGSKKNFFYLLPTYYLI